MGFEYDEKNPIHKPITAKINGKTYTANTLDRQAIKKIEQLARDAVKGDSEAAYKQLEIIFGKHLALDRLDIRVVDRLLKDVTEQIFNPELADTPGKKATGPGDKSSPS